MTTSHRTRVAGLAPTLSGLRAAAPAGLSFEILERVGIVDAYEAVEFGPVGTVFVAVGSRGVSCVDLGQNAEAFEEDFRTRFGRPVRRGSVPLELLRALEAGRTTGFDVDLRGVGSFRQAALHAIREIPRGEVRSYGWVAATIGRDRAMRAVGTAMATNPIPLLVPCHRVVRNDGHIGNYGLGGPSVKAALLRHEGVDPGSLRELAAPA